jgi:glutathione S-transferase
MLEHKGIPYKRVDLMPYIAKGALRGLGFPAMTVPAMKLDGRRVQGSREIARELDRVKPDPPLLPSDPEKRAAVEEAEAFGDVELQHSIRQTLWWTIKKDKAPLRSYSEGARLGIPVDLAMLTAAPIIALSSRSNEASDENVRRDLAALPGQLDRIDAWIEAGVIGGEQPNVADFQIAPSLGLMMTLDDLRPAVEGRPAGKLAQRLVPHYPGRTPPVLPAAWLEPLDSLASA